MLPHIMRGGKQIAAMLEFGRCTMSAGGAFAADERPVRSVGPAPRITHARGHRDAMRVPGGRLDCEPTRHVCAMSFSRQTAFKQLLLCFGNCALLELVRFRDPTSTPRAQPDSQLPMPLTCCVKTIGVEGVELALCRT